MPGYIPFTDEQKLLATRVDLPSFLAQQNVELVRSGSEYKLAADPYIHIRGSSWYDQAEGKGGNPISLVRRLYSVSYPEAMGMLLGGGNLTAPELTHRQPQREKKPFVLPPAHANMRRTYAYLTQQRCIPGGLVNQFAREGLLYESAEPSKDGAKTYHNAVFVGRNEAGQPRHAHKHGIYSGSSYKGNIAGSDPRHSFHHIGVGSKLYVFEAPIDLLSFIALHPNDWQQRSYVALCGVSAHAMLHTLESHLYLQKAALCLDNDERGVQAARQLQQKLIETGYEDI